MSPKLRMYITSFWSLSYPNFVRGWLFANIWILAFRIKLLNTNCHTIRRVLWRFRRKCAKYSKGGQKGHFWGIFQPLVLLGSLGLRWPARLCEQGYFWRKQAARLGELLCNLHPSFPINRREGAEEKGSTPDIDRLWVKLARRRRKKMKKQGRDTFVTFLWSFFAVLCSFFIVLHSSTG